MRPPALPFVLSLLLALPAAAQQLFETPVLVAETAGGKVRGVGDFDGDGDIDLLHVLGSTTTAWTGMRVLRNDGKARFAPEATLALVAPFGVDVGKRRPLVGDFDGDGALDVAVDHDTFSTAPRGIEVHFGDGDAGFAGSAFVAFARAPTQMVVGQVDADPADEIGLLVHVTAGQRALVWLDWTGAGFATSAPLPVGGTPDPAGAFVLAVGDLDADGDDDLAATSLDHAEVRLFPTVAGAATYGPSYPVPAAMQDAAHRLRGGDLDGDGDDDLVHLWSSPLEPGPWVQVYEGVGGALAQRPVEVVPTPETWFDPHELRLADWDGDGHLDLLSNVQYLDVLRSDGDLTFSDGFRMLSSGLETAGGAADLDGDGRTDYAGGRTLVLGDGDFAVPAAEPSPAVAALPDGPHALDLEGDGDVDLAGGPEGLRYESAGDGTYVAVSALFPDAGPGRSWEEPVAFADLDGDGRRDYLVARSESVGGSATTFVDMRLLRDDGLGGYEDAQAATAPGVEVEAPAPFAGGGYWDAADADSDGDLDVLVDGGYWRNDGTGLLDGPVAAWSGRAIDGADVDADGDVDLLADSGSTLVLLEATGGGFVATPLGAELDRGAFVDLDGDGDPDVLATEDTFASIHVLENRGGELALAQVLGGRAPADHDAPALDVDGDGTLEVLTTRPLIGELLFLSDSLAVHRRVGASLAYELDREYVLWGGGEPRLLLDADQDGDVDVLAISALFRGALVPAPEGGGIQQFGAGFPGTGGATPVLGATGPVLSTSSADELRIVRGVGGGIAIAGWSLLEVDLPNVPFPGMSLFVGPPIVLLPLLPLSGAPGEPGTGEATYTLENVPFAFGYTFVKQAFVIDPGSATGFSSTNGLRVTFGL